MAANANQSATSTNTEVDSALAAQANQSTTYTRTEIDSALHANAKQSTSGVHTEVDSPLDAMKENQQHVQRQRLILPCIYTIQHMM